MVTRRRPGAHTGTVGLQCPAPEAPRCSDMSKALSLRELAVGNNRSAQSDKFVAGDNAQWRNAITVAKRKIG
jgi:hypothetical protein